MWWRRQRWRWRPACVATTISFPFYLWKLKQHLWWNINMLTQNFCQFLLEYHQFRVSWTRNKTTKRERGDFGWKCWKSSWLSLPLYFSKISKILLHCIYYTIHALKIYFHFRFPSIYLCVELSCLTSCGNSKILAKMQMSTAAASLFAASLVLILAKCKVGLFSFSFPPFLLNPLFQIQCSISSSGWRCKQANQYNFKLYVNLIAFTISSAYPASLCWLHTNNFPQWSKEQQVSHWHNSTSVATTFIFLYSETAAVFP